MFGHFEGLTEICFVCNILRHLLKIITGLPMNPIIYLIFSNFLLKIPPYKLMVGN